MTPAGATSGAVPAPMGVQASSETITRLRVRAVEMPLADTVTTSAGSMTSASFALVDVVAASGLAGTSYASVYSRAALASLVRLVTDLEEVLVGRPIDPAGLTTALRRTFALDGRSGLVGCAIAAVDMAAWDAVARARGIPLRELLGAAPGTTLETYVALTGWTAVELARAAEVAVGRGFTAVKAKIGHPTLDEDLAVVDAVRAATGDATAIMVDYNQLLDLDEAARRCQALVDRGVAWIEEPIRCEDHAGNALLARETGAAIQLGENLWSADAVGDAAAADASRLVMLDAMRIGGVTGWLEAVTAAGPGRRVSSHGFIEFSSHLLAATPGGHFLEWTDRAATLMVEGSPRLENGRALPLDSPGAGIVWNEEAVRRHAAT